MKVQLSSTTACVQHRPQSKLSIFSSSLPSLPSSWLLRRLLTTVMVVMDMVEGLVEDLVEGLVEDLVEDLV